MGQIDNDKIQILSIAESTAKMVLPFVAGTDLKAGFPSPAADYLEDQIDLNKLLIQHASSTFMAKVTGDSMAGAFISDPATLIIDRAIQPQQNDIVLAAVNGEFTVKFYTRKAGNVILVPANEKYQPTIISDGMTFLVHGVVTWVLMEPRKLNNVKSNVRPRRLQ
jgi:DNA polymerase V